EDGIRDPLVTGVQTCALPISRPIVAAAMTPAECEQAVRRALRVLPSASCLAQAIAAACLLRRDGRDSTLTIGVRFDAAHRFHARSEERRVGKECRDRGGADVR